MPQISEITAVDAPDIFQRPIYAGNAIETVEAKGFKKIITVRASSFAAAAGGGDATIETVPPGKDPQALAIRR